MSSFRSVFKLETLKKNMQRNRNLLRSATICMFLCGVGLLSITLEVIFGLMIIMNTHEYCFAGEVL